MKSYTHIFFDLDRTLWDLDKNTNNTFLDLYLKHKLFKFGIPSHNHFLKIFTGFNDQLWAAYRTNAITKEFLKQQRFRLTLNEYNIKDETLIESLATDYVNIAPTKTTLIPFAIETLAYLSKKKYQLHILTNGFKEVQTKKIDNSNLNKYFISIITSEEAGCKKPSREIFKFSIKYTNAVVEKSLMIGDDWEVDIAGAQQIGMDQVFLNPQKIIYPTAATYTIKCLSELQSLL